MPSLLPGYEYDIFISYRHNDNRSGWVTDFVKALQEELAATIKEPVSVYFDSNPHDGLLETHNVDESLEGKLKCLIFIPILSQTYCDSKSFAWQHEFMAFNKLAKEDQFGRDIKLANGNVANRILPIKIHDLDDEDKSTIENEIGEGLRALEFIYKEKGVNRSLRAEEESPAKNLNQTSFRNQINKVANAVKEILGAMKSPGAKTQDRPLTIRETSPTKKKITVVTIVVFISLLLIYGFYSFIRVNDTGSDSIGKTIAVLPFVDMTPSNDMEYLGDGIAEEIINSLTTITELKVAGRTSSFQFKGEKVDLHEIGEKLHVDIVLEGSIQKFEDNFRITAQLVRTKDNFHIWSERFDLKQMNIFKIQDSIASAIVTKLKLTLSSTEKGKIIKKEINEAAYTLFLKGLFKYKEEKFTESVNYLSESIKIDSVYAASQAYMGLSKAWICANSKSIDSTLLKEALIYSERAIELDPNLAEGFSSIALIAWRLQNDFAKASVYFGKSIALNPSASLIKNRYGYFLTWMGDFKKASQLANEAIKLDPADYNGYMVLFNAALYSQNFDDSKKYLDEYTRLFGFTNYAFNCKIKLDFFARSYRSVINGLDSINKTGASLDASQLSILSRTYFQLRQKDESDKVLTKLKEMTDANYPNSCFATSLVYAFRNETDACIAYLKMSAARREPNLIYLKIEPAFVSVRKDQRFAGLLRENGFEKY